MYLIMEEPIDELLTIKFIEGLKRFNLSIDEIKEWKICGGTSDMQLLNSVIMMER